MRGVGSALWRQELERADTLVTWLRDAVPADVRLVITGDHGMLNVPRAQRVVAEDEPGLLADVTALAGEGRLRQLMTGLPAAVVQRWRDRLGDRAWVRTRDEAVDEGWFGPLSPRLAGRFGDVLVAMADDGAVMSRTLAREFQLVGMHGSLTRAELEVPLLFA